MKSLIAMFRRKPKPPIAPPEWLIVGLGNPGPEYARTRHNLGFAVVDELARRHGIRVDQRKHRAVYGVGEVRGTVVVIAKPMTFMNLSGQAVAPLARSYGLGPDRVLVVSDDLDLEVGRVRMKPKGGAGGHNGHKSIIAALGTQEYPRLKIGVGKGSEAVEHVLGGFRPDERAAIDAAIVQAADGVETLLTEGLDIAISRTNSAD